jgi:hypothetical protein
MFNVSHETKGNKLVITIDLSDEARAAAKPSSTGKTLLVAGTGGFVKIGDVSLSLNATIKKPA